MRISFLQGKTGRMVELNQMIARNSISNEEFVYLDKTTALHPLHIIPDGFQIPETFPFGV